MPDTLPQPILTCELPFRLTSPNVARRDGHWGDRSRRSKAHRTGACNGLMAKHGRMFPPRPPLRVLLTRLGPGTLDDDSVPGACKAIRDGVADFLGIDDRHSDLVKYDYAQERRKQWGVRIEIFRREP